MKNQRIGITFLFAIVVLAAIPASAQFPLQGDDSTSSLASFKVQIAPQFVGLSAAPWAQAPP